MAKLIYIRLSSLAEFATTSDRQRNEAFIRRWARIGLYGAGDNSANQLAEDADDSRFRRVMYSEHHVLQHFLPDINSYRYSLRVGIPTGGNFGVLEGTGIVLAN